MAEHTNPPIDPKALPAPRGWSKRLRHRRRDFQWRRQFSPPAAGRLAAGTPDPACPDFAVGAIAVSPKFADWCLTMLQTLRDAGDYRGPVYVVTDQPAMFAALANVFCIEVPPTRVKLLCKCLKPMLFEWLPQKYVAYIDADVIVTGQIADWYRQAIGRLDELESPLLTYEADNPVPHSFHGGLLFAERVRALPFLRSWLSMLRSGRYLSDQAALRRVATTTTPAYFGVDGFTYIYRMLEQGERRIPTFVHVTDGTIVGHARRELESFMRHELGVTRLPSTFGDDD